MWAENSGRLRLIKAYSGIEQSRTKRDRLMRKRMVAPEAKRKRERDRPIFAW